MTDPRYDPAFQRGYAGPVPVSKVPKPGRAARLDAPPAAEVASEAVDAEPDADDPVASEEALPARRMRELLGNPFLVALTVLGLVLLIGGITWANQGRLLVATRGGAGTELDYWFLQSTIIGAPLTVLAGVGIIAGVLFIAASAWNRRSR